MRRERTLVVIIWFKLARGGLWLVLAATIVGMIQMGLGDRMLGLAAHLRQGTHVWSLELADVVAKVSTQRRLWLVVVALVADGLYNLVEAWALLRGHWWGPWLVVVGTGSFLPLEVVAFAHRPHLVRALVFLINLAIVVYLARKAIREGRDGETAGSPASSASAPPTPRR